MPIKCPGDQGQTAALAGAHDTDMSRIDIRVHAQYVQGLQAIEDATAIGVARRCAKAMGQRARPLQHEFASRRANAANIDGQSTETHPCELLWQAGDTGARVSWKHKHRRARAR